MTTIKEVITEYVGLRCDDYEPGCVICQVWNEYDTLVKHQKDKALEEEMWLLVHWFATLPVENQITMMSALVKDKPERLNTDAVSKWAANNATAIAIRQADKSMDAKGIGTPSTQWTTPRSFTAASAAMGGPGKGKSEFIKNRVQTVKLKRPRKRDLKGFVKKEE